MKSKKEMQESVGKLAKQLGDINAELIQANREPDEEERKLIRQIQVRIKDLEEQIELAEETEKINDRLARSQQEPTRPDPADSLSTPPDDTGRRHQGDLQIGREPDPNRFSSFGEMLMAVRAAGNPDRPSFDPRLRIESRATGLSEGVASEGGFLLPDNFSNELIATVWNEPDILAKISKTGITKGNNMKIPGINETSRADGSRHGGIQMYWEGEAGEKTATKPDFRMIDLTLKKVVGLCYATDELLDDAAALESYIRRAFSSEMQFKLTDALINGTGAGMPLGILASACLVTVAKETGQAAATLQVENLTKMWSRMVASARLNAVWHINQDIEPQLYTMGITVGTGGSPIFMPPGGLSASPYATIMGRPVIPLEQCKTLGTKGDIYLASWPHYVAIDKGGMQSAISIHVRFIYDESVFRFTYRFDGQPELAAAIRFRPSPLEKTGG
jgi:HK97 family phage major capsid protein